MATVHATKGDRMLPLSHVSAYRASAKDPQPDYLEVTDSSWERDGRLASYFNSTLCSTQNRRLAKRPRVTSRELLDDFRATNVLPTEDACHAAARKTDSASLSARPQASSTKSKTAREVKHRDAASPPVDASSIRKPPSRSDILQVVALAASTSQPRAAPTLPPKRSQTLAQQEDAARSQLRRNSREQMHQHLFGQADRPLSEEHGQEPYSTIDEGSDDEEEFDFSARGARQDNLRKRLSRRSTTAVHKVASLRLSLSNGHKSHSSSFLLNRVGSLHGNDSTTNLLPRSNTASPHAARTPSPQVTRALRTPPKAAFLGARIDVEAAPSPSPSPFRGSSSTTPGLATRHPSDKLRKPPSPRTLQAQPRLERDYYFNPSLSESSPLSRLAALDLAHNQCEPSRAPSHAASFVTVATDNDKVSEPQWSQPPTIVPARCGTPTSVIDYGSLGPLSLGALRITNGVASPAPSILSTTTTRQVRSRASFSSDRRTRSVSHVTPVAPLVVTKNIHPHAVVRDQYFHRAVSDQTGAKVSTTAVERGSGKDAAPVQASKIPSKQTRQVSHSGANGLSQPKLSCDLRASVMAEDYKSELLSSPFGEGVEFADAGLDICTTSKPTEIDDALFDTLSTASQDSDDSSCLPKASATPHPLFGGDLSKGKSQSLSKAPPLIRPAPRLSSCDVRQINEALDQRLQQWQSFLSDSEDQERVSFQAETLQMLSSVAGNQSPNPSGVSKGPDDCYDRKDEPSKPRESINGESIYLSDAGSSRASEVFESAAQSTVGCLHPGASAPRLKHSVSNLALDKDLPPLPIKAVEEPKVLPPLTESAGMSTIEPVVRDAKAEKGGKISKKPHVASTSVSDPVTSTLVDEPAIQQIPGSVSLARRQAERELARKKSADVKRKLASGVSATNAPEKIESQDQSTSEPNCQTRALKLTTNSTTPATPSPVRDRFRPPLSSKSTGPTTVLSSAASHTHSSSETIRTLISSQTSDSQPSTNADKGRGSSKKLRKMRPSSLPPPINRIVMQRQRSIDLGSVPTVPEEAAQRAARRVAQLPPLERTQPSIHQRADEKSSPAMPRVGQPVRFPSPPRGKDGVPLPRLNKFPSSSDNIKSTNWMRRIGGHAGSEPKDMRALRPDEPGYRETLASLGDVTDALGRSPYDVAHPRSSNGGARGQSRGQRSTRGRVYVFAPHSLNQRGRPRSTFGHEEAALRSRARTAAVQRQNAAFVQAELRHRAAKSSQSTQKNSALHLQAPKVQNKASSATPATSQQQSTVKAEESSVVPMDANLPKLDRENDPTGALGRRLSKQNSRVPPLPRSQTESSGNRLPRTSSLRNQEVQRSLLNNQETTGLSQNLTSGIVEKGGYWLNSAPFVGHTRSHTLATSTKSGVSSLSLDEPSRATSPSPLSTGMHTTNISRCSISKASRPMLGSGLDVEDYRHSLDSTDAKHSLHSTRDNPPNFWPGHHDHPSALPPHAIPYTRQFESIIHPVTIIASGAGA